MMRPRNSTTRYVNADDAAWGRLPQTTRRITFSALGIEADERVVQIALPKIERALDVMERELNAGRPFLIGNEVTLAIPSAASPGKMSVHPVKSS